MPVVPTREIVHDAFRAGYGVPAINVFNDLSLEAVLAAAVEVRSPVIVQTSVKTVKSIGAKTFFAMWGAMTEGIQVPVSLHLDHCPDGGVITECLALGWNSVLFDASQMPVAQNQRQTLEVVAEARSHGADVEGEIEAITGIEDGHGSDDDAGRESLDTALGFLATTGVDFFAPAIGNAHGVYRSAPQLDVQRVRDIVGATGIPVALHGGTGIDDDDVRALIAAGAAKVNISTGLKHTFMKASLTSLRAAEEAGRWDPPTLFREVLADVSRYVEDLAKTFGSAGRAA